MTSRRSPGRSLLVSVLVPLGALLAMLGVALAVGLPALRSAAIAPTRGSWQLQLLAAGPEQRDAHGERWLAGTRPVGGEDVTAEAPPGTSSPQLYQRVRWGATSWSIDVPGPGYYAVDLLLATPADAGPGANVFDVLGSGVEGVARPLQQEVTLVADPERPQHAAGVVHSSSRRVEVRFQAREGRAAVSGIRVVALGPDAPSSIVRETFDGPAGSPPPQAWRPVTGAGPFGDAEIQGYDDDARAVALDGAGNLVLTARAEPYRGADPGAPVQPWTSARLETKGRVAVTYGDVSATLRVPEGQGLWPAFWLLGTDIDQVDWPRSGEIDVMEVLGGRPSQTYGAVRGLGDEQDETGWRDQPVSRMGIEHDTAAPLSDAPHTYSAKILPGTVTFALDGVPFGTISNVDRRPGQQWPIGKPYYLLLNLAVGGTWGGPPDASTPPTASLVVDDVVVEGWR
ncbi:hypothetical protein NUM3379_18120 [Kineococcus sp. NUM-3379]